MNVWGLVVAGAGGVCIFISAKGTQGKVWQMVAGNTALSSTAEATQLNKLPSGALPVNDTVPGTK